MSLSTGHSVQFCPVCVNEFTQKSSLDVSKTFLGHFEAYRPPSSFIQRKIRRATTKGQNRFRIFHTFHTFSEFFPQDFPHSKQRVSAQGEQKRRKDNKKNRTNRCCTLAVARLSSSYSCVCVFFSLLPHFVLKLSKMWTKYRSESVSANCERWVVEKFKNQIV